MKRKYIEPFFNEIVTIAVPHRFLERKFYLTGKIVEIHDKFLILQKENGVQQIVFEDIVEINQKERKNG